MKAPNWKCINQQARWQGRDSQGSTLFQDQMWILGGWFTPKENNPRDVWSSPNGIDWKCHTNKAPWEFSDLPVTLAFKDRLWIMGGRKLPGKLNSNEVWSSSNGADWTLDCPSAGWCPRVSAAHVVFKDRMWVIGGTENFYEDSDRTLHNDVWATTNGRDWICVTEHAPWAARAHHQAIVFDDKLWIIGGGGRFPEPHTRNDVWCSEDGEHWTLVTQSAAWAPRIWHTTAVYRDHLWVIAGLNQEIDNLGDVWCSPDGVTWTQLDSDNIWTARHAPALFTHQDKLILVAGHARPVNSEVWSLELPKDFRTDD